MLFRRYIRKYRGKALAVIIAVAIFASSYIALYSTVETFVGSIAYNIQQELHGTQLIVRGNFTLADIEQIASRPEVKNIDALGYALALVAKPTGGYRFAVAMFFLPSGIFGQSYNITNEHYIAISDFFARHFEIGDAMNVTLVNGNVTVSDVFYVSSTFKAERSLVRPRFDLVISLYYYFKYISPTVDTLFISATNKTAVIERLKAMPQVQSVEDIEYELENATKEARQSMTGVQFVNLFIGLLGGILIAGTFYIVVEERRKHIAVLRAMGASGFNLVKEFSLEGLLLGVIGWLVGVLIALPLIYFGSSLLVGIVKYFGYSISLEKIIISRHDVYRSFIYSILLVFLGLLPPLIYALRVRPIEAMRPPIITISGFPVKSLIFAVILGGLAVYSYTRQSSLNRDNYYFSLVALTLLFIVLLRAADRILGKLFSFSPSSFVGIRLANIHVKRTVMIGVLLAITVGTIAPLASSAGSRHAYIEEFSNTFNFQLFVYLPGPVEEPQADYIAHEAINAGADRVAFVAYSDGYFYFRGENFESYYYVEVLAMINDNITDYFNLDLLAGHKYLEGNEIALFDREAETLNVSVGDTLTLEVNNATYVVTVGAIFEYHRYYRRIERNENLIFLSPSLARAFGLNNDITMLLIKAPQDKLDAIKYAVMDTLGPVITVRKVSEVIGFAKRVYFIVFLFFTVFIALILTIALVSVIVTIRQLGYELRGIAGMLRAIGLDERSTIAVFVIASIAMSLTGIIPALIFAYPVSKLVREQDVRNVPDLPYHFPTLRYALAILGLIVLIGFLGYLSIKRLKKKTVVELLRERFLLYLLLALLFRTFSSPQRASSRILHRRLER